MNLHEVFPLDELRSRFDAPVKVEQLGLADLDEIYRREPSNMAALGIHAWNRIVNHPDHSNLDPRSLGPYINGGDDPSFIGIIQLQIGCDLIYDISYTVCTIEDSALDDKVVARALIADVYPSDLHIGDVYFRNPYKPIPRDERKYKYREYEGLRLLRPFMEGVDSFAAKSEVQFVTLTAATVEHVPLFRTYGFALQLDPIAREARAMQKPVKKQPNCEG